MTARIITYRSMNNSDPDQQWMGFVEINKKRLGIWFPAPTEEEAKEKVRAFWKKEREKRDAAEARAAAFKGKNGRGQPEAPAP